jgi:uncharacterized membrane protein
MSSREPARVLIAGESWIMHTIHQKGVDDFRTTAYGEGHGWLQRALEEGGFAVEHLPNHLASARFPTTPEVIGRYAAVILSDIGSNTLLLHPDTFERSRSMPNRLTLLRDYAWGGGGLIMVGGYLTFQGIDAKARYAGTAVEEALPVTILPQDDRVEVPEGAAPRLTDSAHPIAAGLPEEWPALLGYNRIVAKSGATVVATVPSRAGGVDPLVVAWEFGTGRAVAFASDCGPHWAPPAFVEWDGYARLWTQLVGWAARR